MEFTHSLIAHRGWQRRYPENTLAGIEAALREGAKHIEIDIQLTADYVAILCHDQSLLRVCAVDENINTLNHAQLSGISAYEPGRFGEQHKGTPLSTLAECAALLEPYADVTLYVEIKEESLNSFGADCVLHNVLPALNAIRERCYLISFDIPVLLQARRAGWQLIAPVLTDLEQLASDEFKQLAPEMAFCDSELINDRKLLQRINYPLALYEIDQYDDAVNWLNQGAALVETFAIGELLAAHRSNADA